MFFFSDIFFLDGVRKERTWITGIEPLNWKTRGWKHSQRSKCLQWGNQTNPLGLAKRCLLGDGLMVPVDDAEEADDVDEESSSRRGEGSGRSSSSSNSSSSFPSSSSIRVLGGMGGSKGRPDSLALANARWRSLIVDDLTQEYYGNKIELL